MEDRNNGPVTLPFDSVTVSRSEGTALTIIAEVYIPLSGGVCFCELAHGPVNNELLGHNTSADYRWFEAKHKPRVLQLLIGELYPREADYKAWLERAGIPEDESPEWRDSILLLLLKERCPDKHSFKSWLDSNSIKNDGYWH
jgi:hypothetical protein